MPVTTRTAAECLEALEANAQRLGHMAHLAKCHIDQKFDFFEHSATEGETVTLTVRRADFETLHFVIDEIAKDAKAIGEATGTALSN